MEPFTPSNHSLKPTLPPIQSIYPDPAIMKVNNKVILLVSAVLLLIVSGLVVAQQRDARAKVLVYKTPTCGCCAKWVGHMEKAGFEVETRDLTDLSAIKNQYGVQRSLSSCHTAIVDGYIVEGHVPPEFVTKLLEERPDVKGITVPGMPIGSPGMEGPNPQAYDVLSFDAAGKTAVFAHVTP